MKAILAIDQGTTASKAALFSPSGRTLGLARVPVRTTHGPGGRVEQDPLHLLATQKLAIRRALAAAGHPRVIAAGIASQRSTFVMWERDSGRPVAAAPTWQDTSAVDVCARLEPSDRRVRRLTGLPLSPHYSASKVAALMGGLRGLHHRARRGEVLFGSVASYLLWQLSGGAVHAIDPTLGARTLLMNIETLRWEAWLLELFDVPKAILPEVRPSLGDFGSIRIGGAEVPVRACLGDQQAALAGATGTSLASGASPLVNYGTGAFALIPTGAAPVRRDGLLTSLAWSSASRRAYLLEGTGNAAGAALDWLRRELQAPERLDQIDRLCRRGPGLAQLLPAFWGLGSVYASGRDRMLPSIALNLGPSDTLADLTRAAVEAIAHIVAVILDRAQGASRAPRRLVATGGLARLRYLLEFQAALLPHTELVVSRRAEATLAGIARAAAAGTPECDGRAGAWVAPTSRPVEMPRELRRVAVARHTEWRRLIELGRIWRQVPEASR